MSRSNSLTMLLRSTTWAARLAVVAVATTALGGCGFIGGGDSEAPIGSTESGYGNGNGGESAGAGGGNGSGEQTGLPCDVDHILQSRCQTCHSSTPIGGAPMPLVDWSDLHANAVSAPDSKVFELAAERIRDEDSPMPPSHADPLTPEERTKLLAFLDGEAPRAEEDCNAVVPGDEEPWGIEAMGCKPDYVFTSHAPGDVTKPFVLPPDQANAYYCFGFQVPWNAKTEGLEIAPILGDARVVHHAILYTTSQGLEHEGVFPCENMPADTQFLAGFQPTAPRNLVMPENVGFELPDPGQWVFMQVHYWNAAGLTDVVDQTGLAFCTSEEPRPQQAGILWLGTIAIEVPPLAKNITTSSCWTAPTDLNILASGPHMHKLGRKFNTDLRRTDGSVEPVVAIDNWDFANQEIPIHDPVIPVKAGDSFHVSCTYDNPSTKNVTFGERTEDEMCFDFTLVYPIAGLPKDRRFWAPCF